MAARRLSRTPHCPLGEGHAAEPSPFLVGGVTGISVTGVGIRLARAPQVLTWHLMELVELWEAGFPCDACCMSCTELPEEHPEWGELWEMDWDSCPDFELGSSREICPEWLQECEEPVFLLDEEGLCLDPVDGKEKPGVLDLGILGEWACKRDVPFFQLPSDLT